MPEPARRNPSLSPRERLASAEAERARWAGELHDETLQGLTSLRLCLAAMEGADPIAAQELIQHAIVDLERQAEKLRGLIVEIRPVALDQLGIAAALEALADRVEKPKLEVRTTIELGAGEGPPAGPARRRAGDRDLPDRPGGGRQLRQTRPGDPHPVEVIERAERAEVEITVRDDGAASIPRSSGRG